jgi:inosine/xanthosine triphosphate pyrophosphatase family protein
MAELTLEQKNKISHRAAAISLSLAYLGAIIFKMISPFIRK